MARVVCRCGETLQVTRTDPDRLTCPRCRARIRIRRSPEANSGVPRSDGYIRFHCPCGRRLKVRATVKPEAGKCPDCGSVVPVPETAWQAAAQSGNTGARRQPGQSDAVSRTQDMDVADLERLEQWANRLAKINSAQPFTGDLSTTSHQAFDKLPDALGPLPETSQPLKTEAGLRVCPRCGKPLHMSATVCRSCGEPVPKR
jgi:hypothetical protein